MNALNREAMVILRGLAGAVVGGLLGWFAFGWLAQQGFYGLALPGALVGLLCGAVAGGTSLVNAVVCTAVAIVLGLVLEWKHFPFAADESFGYFLKNVGQLRGMTWLMLIVGACFAFWFGRGRNRGM